MDQNSFTHKSNLIYKAGRRPFFLVLSGILLAAYLSVSCPLNVQAAQTWEERVAAQKGRPIESNEVDGWPAGPVVTADSAILMEAGTGTILYAKNIHQAQYPASCTKLLTCLIAAEQCKMDEIVTMSYKAIFDTPLDSSYISLDVGNQITMEQALNAVLICSANNVAFAVAEHIVDSDWEDFSEVMNERAAQLGCVDSHFVNPNGLPDENHYTSAYDLAMIGRAFFDNELLSRISRTTRLHLPPTDTQPKDIIENTKNKLLPNQSMAYEYLVGSKTGYTNAARSCLVSCAQKDGLKLICVVLKDEAPLQYEDTLALFEYGFSNFTHVNISETETKYNINTTDIFHSENDILGSSRPLLRLNPDDYLVLPKTIAFEDTVSRISYDTTEENQVALITYTYHDVPVGTASVDFVSENSESYVFEDAENGGAASPAGTEAFAQEASSPETAAGSETLMSGETIMSGDPIMNSESADKEPDGSPEHPVVLINIKEAILWTAIVLAVMALIYVAVKLIRFRNASHPRRPRHYFIADDNPYLFVSDDLRRKRREAARRAKGHRRAKRPNRFRDYDF